MGVAQAAAKAPQRKRPCRSRATARRSVLQRAAGVYALRSQIENYRAKAKKFARQLQPLQNPRDKAANAENLLRCIGRSRWARNLSARRLRNRTSKGAGHGHVSRRVSQTFRAEMGKSH